VTVDIAALSTPFPPAAISWRAQSVSKKNPDAPKAMALAYIDARDVMNRLDDVCGPDGWEDSYTETPLGRVICTIRVRCGEHWVSKSDGAGKTDVEGDKGGISDAFKRAAVKWGIGRYLYDMPTPWVACELYNDKWSKWTADGLAELQRIAQRNSPQATRPDPDAKINDTQRDWLISKAEASVGVAELCKYFGKNTLKDFTVGELEPARDWLKSPTAKAA